MRHATALAAALARELPPPRSRDDDAPPLCTTAACTLQQADGYNCGVHVICNARAVAGALVAGGGWEGADAAVAAAGAGAAQRERARLRAEILGR